MDKNNYVGIVDKIKVIKSFPNMLVRFTLHTVDTDIQCIVCKKELANLLLFLDNNKYEVAVFGHANLRKQLIVEKFMVRNPNSFIHEFVTKTLSKTS
ncbi:hypothetical protein [Enterococcus sp. 5H]|uniref:hypothetical protein n=1 Tax=Enterococcus sp. 5H TaxID=1229490 RepID=UPI0023040F4B|nr:hypothetical protein [Enterococcus sp. 5H]MDA9471969.1 hypothetical protein [Enterococcus sp. 5H]